MHEPVRDRSYLDLKVLIHFLLEIMCSKHQRSNTWQEIRILPSNGSRQTCLLSTYCVFGTILNIMDYERKKVSPHCF